MRLLPFLTLFAALGLIGFAHSAEVDVRLEASVDTPAPYVQAQVIYTARLYQAIPLDSVEFHPPAAPMAEVRPLGDARVSETELSGRRYRVTERRYAVFPFASGPQSIEGQVSARARGQALVVSAPSVPLTVRPAPTDRHPWLPALALTLSADQGIAAAPAPGEALRWTVRMDATGLEAAHLPALTFHGESYSAHALPPRLENRYSEDGVTSTREQTWLIIPRRSGALTLAGIGLDWHDLRTDEPRRAELPPVTLDVTGPADNAGSPAPSHTSSAVQPLPEASRSVAPGSSATAIAIATLAGVAALLFAVSMARQNPALKAARRSCRRHDARATHDALVRWGRTLGPQVLSSLPALARHFGDPVLARELDRLERARFGGVDCWDGKALRAALRPYLHAKCKSGRRARL